jgi:ferredoxin-NADP reductase
MRKQNRNLKVVFTLNEANEGWTGYTGRIDAEMITKEIPDYRERVCYICGPPAMLRAMKKILEDLEVPKENMKTEYFSGY